MSRENKEIKTYFGRCRCCLGFGYLNNMWEEYNNGDQVEVYGEMLIQCYALSWEHPESVKHDQICDSCVQKLRNAYNFKKLVIKSQKDLMEEIENESKLKVNVKIEATDDAQIEFVTVTYEDAVLCEEDVPNMDVDNVEKETVLYEDVEYLEEELALDSKEDINEPLPLSRAKRDTRQKLKWPKKLPPNERNKRYLQYTADDIHDAINAVRTNKMTTLEASQFYKVPRKTLAAKLREEKKGVKKDPTSDKTYIFLKEIKTILTYTNGTPYRSKISQYSCMYCVQSTFDDPADLRNHTRTKHMDDRTKKIDVIMRPHWQNEILKLDIENLLCVVCCTPIYDWNGMFQHLKEKHQVVLDQAYRRVIPYNLSTDLHCTLCKEKFISYHQLDGHMNTHYDNYVCGTCGDTFLTLTRLKSHTKIHSSAIRRCNYCPKVFNTDNNRKKHENIVHKRTLFYKCMHCDVRFTCESERKNHVTEVHVDKMRVMTCELCGKTFNWQHYFTSHMRKVHGSKNFECSLCGKRYLQKSKLEHHLAVRHKDENKT